MKKTIEGYLFNRIETLGNKKYKHVGFEDEKKMFGDLMESFVPKIGSKLKVKLSIEVLND